MRRTLLFLISAASVCFSCAKLTGVVDIREIGFPVSTVDLEYNSESAVVEVLSNGDYTITIPEDCEWLTFNDGSRLFHGNGDGDVRLVCLVNRSIPRTVELTAVKGTNKAILTVTQEGLLEGGITIVDGSVCVDPDGGESGVRIISKINPSEFSFEPVYSEEEMTGWIGNIRLQNNFVAFSVSPNFAKDVIRHARVYVRAQGEERSFLVCQYPVGTDPVILDVDGLKALSTGDKTKLEGQYFLTGTVLNDWSEDNGAENRMVSVDIADAKCQYKTVYVQDGTGTSGLKLVFADEVATLLPRYSNISLDMNGLTLVKQSNPERYLVEAIPLTAIVAAKSSSAVQPRELKISQLTAKDLYTFVKLTDVEIPVRKGCYAPMDIRKISAITAVPTILRDKEGSSIYMMVNINCPWARDGRTMPRGSGSVQGVIVNETCDSYEWSAELEKKKQDEGYISNYITGLGNIGNWQIRPVVNDDIQIAENFADSFSDILFEWAYADTIGVNLIQNATIALDKIYPTHSSLTAGDPIEPFTMAASLYCANTATDTLARLSLYNDWTHLGPYVYGGQITVPSNGNVVVDDLGRQAHWSPYASVSTTGVIFRSNGSAWATKNWSTTQYWCCEFDASSLVATNSPVSVQFGVGNDLDSYGAPRYWAVEYSLNNSTWTRLMEYTIPDFVVPATKKVYQTAGPKYQSVNLPDNVIGKGKVYVRLIPASSKAGNASSYDSGVITQARYSSINYFAIRYNK